MSIARDHAEWLSLVPTSGPFLSMETLLRVFPQGLPAHDPERTRLLRLAFGEWEGVDQKRRPDQALHTAWIRFVLTTILGLPSEALKEGQGIPEGLKAEKPEFAQTLRPNLILTSLPPQNDELSLDFDGPVKSETDADETTLLLVQTYERSQGLEKPCKGNWTASPVARMAELLLQTQVRLGLVTNGEEWTLVHRATDTVGYATFFATLWLEEPLTLRAFRALLGAERFFGGSDETLLRLLTDSADEQHEVTDQLGYQVRRAVEMLVQALDEIDRGRGGILLAGVPESQLYDGALTVMMRLVFLLCAEERGMFPIEEEIYSRHYAVSTLMESLREAADKDGEEVLERRSDAWSRLLATFRAIWAGVEHEAMRLPAYGGSLLDPHRFPWLDSPGENTAALPLHNRTVLHLLEALQILRLKVPGGGPAETRRLSFRALDIEQIGHVYEGLLDHTAVRTGEPILGLAGTKDKEPEIALARLETELCKGRKELLKYLREETGRSEKALQNGLDNPATDLDEGRLLAACEGNAALLSRVRPFAALVRRDDFGRYVVVPKGSVYVTAGTARRSTGTHYTPRSLTEPIVRRTLEPLIYRGMAQGFEPSPETLRTASEILALKVCDIACGSGAFIVEGCRYLADRLCEAWAIAEQEAPDTLLTTPIGTPATGNPTERLIPDAHETPEERRILARRLIAAHCLYGVDKNPAAVEIAKLSLWLVTMDRDKPFHFLDHAIKSGDSLVGCSREQILTWSLSGMAKPQASILNMLSGEVFEEAISLRQELERLPSDRIEFIERKARLHREAEAKMARARLAADLVIAPALMAAKPKAQEAKRADFQARFVALPNPVNDALLRKEANTFLGDLHPFHWPLEFPDIFNNGGFAAVIGNPPFMGGKKITGELGVPYREHLVASLGRGKKGSADIVAYFFLRALELLKTDGSFGLIATNTIAQGDTREVGLEQIIDDGQSIYAALPSMKWPGKANLEVAVTHTFKGVWGGKCSLSGRDVREITAFLDDGTSSGKPFRLKENAGKCFIGSVLSGIGFVLEQHHAATLVAQTPKNAEVLRPFLNGDDLNSRPDQSPSRWVINFYDWPLGRIGQTLPLSSEALLHVAETMEINISDDWRPKEGSRWAQADEERREKWLRMGVVPSDYPGPVATDYPECLKIVEELVKPDRDTLNREQYKRLWWRFAERCAGLYAAIANLPRVLVVPLVSKHLNVAFESSCYIYSHATGVVANASFGWLSLYQNTVHDIWARQNGSTLETRLRYTPSDCFETFPFPELNAQQQASLNAIGEAYHAHRQRVCLARDVGLTKVYNLFHQPACTDADIIELRRLHILMDHAVTVAYGWDDLALSHDFYGEDKETRYTIHPDAKAKVLRRLLALNHERHAEQEAQADEIMPTLRVESEVRSKKRGDKTVKAKDSAANQRTLDDLLIEKIVADHEKKLAQKLSSSEETFGRAAMMTTYLIMRAEAPEHLARLRRHPTRMRLTTPRRYTRTRLAKHLYFTQEMVRFGKNERPSVTALAFTEYQRGPYTKEILSAEEEAFQRGWLIGEADYHEGRSSVSYRLGPKAEEAVKQVLELLGPSESYLDQELVPLDEPKTTRSEQWTTIHFAWNTLRAQTGRVPSFAEVQAYVSNWKPDREAFAYNTVATIYRELEQRNLLR